jgi:hypothetical protein
VPTPAVLQSGLAFVGLGKETVQGTAVPATIYVPVDKSSLKAMDVPAYVEDDSLDGNIGKIRGGYQGELKSTVDWTGMAYPDLVGNWLVAAGLADTISGAGPYTHAFKVPAAGTVPPSYTITVYNVAETRQYPGCMLDQVEWTIDAKGAVKVALKWLGWPSTTTTKPTPTWPAIAPWQGWQASLSIGGSANAKVLSGKIAIQRTPTDIRTMANVQAPYNIFPDAISATEKWKFAFLDTVDWTHIMSNDQPAVVATLTAPSAGPVLVLTSTKTLWKAAPVDFSNPYVEVGDADITCITNATDIGPIAALLANSVSTAY